MKEQKSTKKVQKHNVKSIRGITLIALVITIVVLLILAAVSITTVFGDNGLLKQASEASVKTKLSTLEEMVNQKYLANLVQSQVNGTSEELVLEELIEEQGYELETRTTGEAEITGIKLSKEQIQMAPNSEETITVTLETTSGEGMQYYVKVDGKYYKVIPSSNGITIERTETKLTVAEEGQKEELTAEIKDGTNVTVKVEGKVITLQSGENVGATTITVKYGSHTKECIVTVVKKPTESSEAKPDTTITTAYGKVDVIWLGTDNSVKNAPNAPILTANNETMTKVKWTEKGTVEEDNIKWTEDAEEPTTDAEWYSYVPATGTSDSMVSRWANAKTANGSYFVWIPRFAYRITYYDKDWTQDDTAKVTGYYDGLGMWNAEGELKYKLDAGIKTIDYNGDKYIVHPAFMDNRENNFDNGGWDKDLAGFWFAKYEMSGDKSAVQTDSKELKSVPSVSSLSDITIGAMYQACRNAAYGYTGKQETFTSGGETVDHTSYMNSHLVKNSEWGAVALLTQSTYGRNGHEIDINNSSSCITGNGGGTVGKTAGEASGTTNTYNTEKGAHASTTGNIYGIYDMSGGAWEYVASYDKKGNVTSYGSDLVEESKSNEAVDGVYKYISTKYATAYENGTTDFKSDTTVYKVSKTGDAVKETGTGSTGWFQNFSGVCNSVTPFFQRGGGYYTGAFAYSGIFYSAKDDGHRGSYYGFRAVLCP